MGRNSCLTSWSERTSNGVTNENYLRGAQMPTATASCKRRASFPACGSGGLRGGSWSAGCMAAWSRLAQTSEDLPLTCDQRHTGATSSTQSLEGQPWSGADLTF